MTALALQLKRSIPIRRDAPRRHIYLSRGYRSGPYAAIRPGGRGDIAATHVVWHVEPGLPTFIDGPLRRAPLLAGDVGVITAVDAKTGSRSGVSGWAVLYGLAGCW